MTKIFLVFIFGLFLCVAIRKWIGLGFIFSHVIIGAVVAVILGVTSDDLFMFQKNALIYFLLWSWWVFVSSVIEHSLTIRILNSLTDNKRVKTYDMNMEFISRVEKLVRSGIVVLDENNGLYSVRTNSRFYKYDLVMKRLFRIENSSLY